MLKPELCIYEDSAIWDDREEYYFSHPIDFSILPCSEDDYQNVVCMTLCLTVRRDGVIDLAISPTVEDEYGASDVDWFVLDIEKHRDLVDALIMKVNEVVNNIL